MEINFKQVRDGHSDGLILWVCHFNQPYLKNKPIRKVPPTKVMVCSNTELPENKRVYYSNSHFVPLNKNGDKLKRIIALADNTSNRYSSGEPLFIFDNECECRAKWDEQINKHIERVDQYLKDERVQWESEKIKLKKL